jgi:mannose-1-phosphate guanylyltransferase
MPLAGRPFLTFMLDWLRGHGVDNVLMSCGYLSAAVEDVLGDEHEGMRLRYVHERQPLGTAGPVRLAHDEGALEERLFVLNGDVLTDMDLTAELEQHERTGAKATLALIEVEDTSSYGVVPTTGDGQVEAFLEKSEGQAPTNRINAGAYILEREVVERIAPGRSVSFEREIFPALVGQGLYGWPAFGYWIDIGTPERYLESTYDLLSGRVQSTLPQRDDSGSLVYDGADTDNAQVGPLSVIDADCSVGAGSVVERAVLHRRAAVGSNCRVVESVIAEGAVVEDGAEVGPDAIVGAGATVSGGARVEAGARVQPGESVR